MIFEKLCTIIGEVFSVDEDTLEMYTSFEDDLDGDTLDVVEIMMAVEEEFDIGPIDESVVENIRTIADAVNIIQDLIDE